MKSQWELDLIAKYNCNATTQQHHEYFSKQDKTNSLPLASHLRHLGHWQFQSLEIGRRQCWVYKKCILKENWKEIMLGLEKMHSQTKTYWVRKHVLILSTVHLFSDLIEIKISTQLSQINPSKHLRTPTPVGLWHKT